MKKIIVILILAGSFSGCEKKSNENQSFQTGTFEGEKTVYYLSTRISSVDTITLQINNSEYSYSQLNSPNSLDFGRGIYTVINDSVEFVDNEARIALYTWDWILGGKYEFEFGNDGALILNKKYPDRQISCRLNRIFAEN